MKHEQEGFTLIELLTVITITILVVGLLGGFFMGNMWYTEKSVLNELKLDHPNITKILKTNRSTWGYSQVTVQEDEKINTYYLDSNIFFSYKFHK